MVRRGRGLTALISNASSPCEQGDRGSGGRRRPRNALPAPFANPKNLRTARHSQDNLKSTIQQVLGPQAETRIRDLEKNLIVTSVDAIENRVVYFSNQKKIGDTACEDATLVDIALATSAAPTYFPPHLIEERYFLDGGIVSNNPDLETLRFLTSVLSRPVESSMILSVGIRGQPGRCNPDLDTRNLSVEDLNKLHDIVSSKDLSSIVKFWP